MQYPLIRFIVYPSPTDTRTMTDIERYLRAATRDNTRRSYQAAIEHFESHWGGFLPATPLIRSSGTMGSGTRRFEKCEISCVGMPIQPPMARWMRIARYGPCARGEPWPA